MKVCPSVSTFPMAEMDRHPVLVDGSLTVPAGQIRKVAAGKEGEFVIHVIAHEIGHVMTNDDHPGASQYKSNLIWEGGKDPFLRKRLMCSSDDLDVANPGTLLIKKEWDRIEAWLKLKKIGEPLIPSP